MRIIIRFSKRELECKAKVIFNRRFHLDYETSVYFWNKKGIYTNIRIYNLAVLKIMTIEEQK